MSKGFVRLFGEKQMLYISNMKKAILLFYLFPLLLTLGFGQNLSLNWSAPVIVAGGNTYGNSWPRIDLTASQIPVVSWGNKTTNQVYVSRMDNGSFTSPVNVLPAGMGAYVANWTGPDLAAWGDSVFVTFSSRPMASGKAYIVRSTDGGLTFSDTIQAGNVGNKIPQFPAIDLAEGGNPVVAFMLSEPGFLDPAWEVVRSWDGGNTFGPIVPGSNGTQGEACDCCPADIHVEGNLQLLPFRNNDANIRDNWLAISENAGASFDTVIQMDANNWFLQACPSQGPDAVIAGDTLVSFWTTGANGSNEVWMTLVEVGTYAVTSSRIFDSIPMGGQFKPRVCAKGDTLAAIWEDGRNGTNFDCFLAWSVNGPSGLETHVENAILNSAGTQQMPDIVFSNGVFHIVYSDISSNEIVYRSATLGPATSVAEAVTGSELNFYPNPTDHSLRVQLPVADPGQSSFRLLDLSGRICFEKPILSSSFEVVTQELPAGIYFAEVSLGKQKFRKKVMVMH